MNETMTTFGYPESTIREYEHWVVLLRPKQVTLGSLVLVCKHDVQSFSSISPEAFRELGTVVPDIELRLSTAFSYDKINYLMLMMVDPHVHFHVIPRYAEAPTLDGIPFPDHGWPGPPDLATPTPTSPDTRTKIRRLIETVSG